MNEGNVKTFIILPALQKSGWNNPEVLSAEYKITDGRVVATSGAKPYREKPKYADYALFHNGQPIAIVEAKKSDVPFAYCCNGENFYEHDRLTHTEREIPIDGFPTSDALVKRVRDFCNYTPDLRLHQDPFRRPQFGNQIEIKDRDFLVAKYITGKLNKIGRMTKTIVAT